MVWYSHLFQNFPQFVVIHIVKGFNLVNEAEVDAFLELSCFFNNPTDVGDLISGSSGIFRDGEGGSKKLHNLSRGSENEQAVSRK